MEKEIEQVEIKDEDTKEEDFSSEELEADTTDWKAKSLELKGIAKRRATQLGKVKMKLNELEGKIKELTPINKPQDKKEEKKSDDRLLEKLENLSLRSANITHPDDIELAKNTAKKWGVDVDEILLDEDFKVKLERQQTNRNNIKATNNIRGGGGGSDIKNTPEYYLSRGNPPTREEIPDRKTRVKIAKAFLSNSKNGKKFYND